MFMTGPLRYGPNAGNVTDQFQENVKHSQNIHADLIADIYITQSACESTEYNIT